jgi:hypothetical protein
MQSGPIWTRENNPEKTSGSIYTVPIYLITKLHGVTIQKNIISIFGAYKTFTSSFKPTQSVSKSEALFYGLRRIYLFVPRTVGLATHLTSYRGTASAMTQASVRRNSVRFIVFIPARNSSWNTLLFLHNTWPRTILKYYHPKRKPSWMRYESTALILPLA